MPTCCSCHVLGYTDLYPPLRKNPPSKLKENFPGADFITEDQPDNFRDLTKSSNFITKQSPSANFDSSFVNGGSSSSYNNEAKESSNYNLFEKNTHSDSTSLGRPLLTPPLRTRPKKPAGGSSSRPFDTLPQQHAPNTRAPGYTGSVSKIRTRLNRPFRRESNSQLDYPSNEETDTNSNR